LSKWIIARLRDPNSRLEKEIQSIVDSRIRAMVGNQGVSKKAVTSQVQTINSISDSLFESICYKVTDYVMDALHSMSQEPNVAVDQPSGYEGSSKPEKQEQTQKKESDEFSTLYATSANDETGEFYSVTSTPNPKETIFELRVASNGKQASFRVYNPSIELVLASPDYLSGACETQRLGGNSQVITEVEGKAALSDDGMWKVVEFAKIIIK
jgi:hypothetical protein